MTEAAELSVRDTSGYHSFYQAIFESADMASVFWQPLLKSMGRSQLEIAGLQARQGQAVVHWAHKVLQPSSPMDLINANIQLWMTMSGQYAEVLPRVTAAVSSATLSTAPVSPPLPKRSRDTLVLLDREPGREENVYDRKVA